MGASSSDSNKTVNDEGQFTTTPEGEDVEVPMQELACYEKCCCCCGGGPSILFDPKIDYGKPVNVDKDIFKQNVRWRMLKGVQVKDVAVSLLTFGFLVSNVWRIITTWVDRPDLDSSTWSWTSIETLTDWKTIQCFLAWLEIGIMSLAIAAFIIKAILFTPDSCKSCLTICCDTCCTNIKSGVNASARDLSRLIKQGSSFSSFYFIMLFEPFTALDIIKYYVAPIWNSNTLSWLGTKDCRYYIWMVVVSVLFVVGYLLGVVAGVFSVVVRVQDIDFVTDTPVAQWDIWEWKDLLLFMYSVGVLGTKTVQPGYKQEQYKWEVLLETSYLKAVFFGMVLQADTFLLLPWSDF